MSVRAARLWLATRRWHWRHRSAFSYLAATCFFGYLIAGAAGHNMNNSWWGLPGGAGYVYGLLVATRVKDPDAPKPPAPRCQCCGQLLPRRSV